MIYDKFCNSINYLGISENLDNALRIIPKLNSMSLLQGRNEINEKIYINYVCSQTQLNENLKFEFHKKYLDIHCLLYGKERILIADTNKLKTTNKYSANEDYGLQEGIENIDIVMSEETFLVCFPNDSHLPMLAVEQPESVKKAIIKVIL